ncbi:olfactory receptor 10A7-like [Leptodactylus fuscus]|uniref:olfactory receptor 10A7-like n=1 Tax=Leptodactylus fuscus TaxID=238119 RepID=UPI003F4E72DC
MCEENQTQVTQIRLLGFRGLNKYKTLLFIVFLLTYIFILVGNFFIILLVTTIDHLKTPMFYFLKHLSTADVLITTTIIPVILDMIFFDEGILSFWGCIMQLYLFSIFGLVQCFLLAVMSYDRYLAICHPLRYSSLMTPDLCLLLVVGSWFIVNVATSNEVFVLIQYNFCGQNSIDHFFCDFGPILELTTSDTSILRLEDTAASVVIIFLPFAFIIVTYCCIFFTILKMSSAYGKSKAFSTCSSHLTTVCVYYGSLMTVYMVPADEGSSNINKYISLLYLVVTPLMNPIIYSLRNNEIKRAMQKLITALNGSQLLQGTDSVEWHKEDRHNKKEQEEVDRNLLLPLLRVYLTNSLEYEHHKLIANFYSDV